MRVAASYFTSEYKALIDALKILHNAQRELDKEEGSLITPHYRMLSSAKRHLEAQADKWLRSEDSL